MRTKPFSLKTLTIVLQGNSRDIYSVLLLWFIIIIVFFVVLLLIIINCIFAEIFLPCNQWRGKDGSER